MKKFLKTTIVLWFVLIAVIFCTCSDDSGSGNNPTPVTFSGVTADGSATQTTTQLTLTFSQAITGLSADNITLSGVSGITKGTLSGSGPAYTLPISGFTAGGSLSVAAAKTGYAISGSPKTVTIYYYDGGSSVTIELVPIPAGTFTMGSPTSEANRLSDETQHSVTLSGFYMGKYQVTQEQYYAVMGTNPSYFHGGSGREPATGENQGKRPVDYVTWYDAVEFCNKLSVKEELQEVYTISERTPATGYPITSAMVTADFSKNGYRLPTEAEWEYACRAGTTTAYNTGDTISDNTGWYRENSGSKTHEVGLKSANAWELYDMHGNVSEWCWDWRGSYPSEAQTDPLGASTGTGRVLRGGGWNSNAQYLRSACRDIYVPGLRNSFIGFRLVRP